VRPTFSVPRVLFDQNVPRTLAPLLSGHTVKTAADQGWQEISDGDLLVEASKAGFEILVTCDQSIRYQQNISRRTIGLIELSTNHWPTIRANAAKILDAINTLPPLGDKVVHCERSG